ncbi:MAG: hypothetical protein WAX80_01855 [Minisyncoccia bacterium]
MTTVINNPGENKESAAASGGAGVIIGAVVVILILVGVIVLALPYIRERVDGMSKPQNATINVQLPPSAVPGTTPTPE